jgi:type IV pilus assembly protein PilB
MVVVAEAKNLAPMKSLGATLVEKGIISLQQLNKALEIQRVDRERSSKFDLASYLLLNKILTEHQLLDIEKKHKINSKLSESLLSDGIITQEQLDIALDKKESHEFIGETLVRLKYIEKKEFYDYLKQRMTIPSLENVIVTEGIVSTTQLQEIMVANTVLRTLGEILTDLGYVSSVKLNEILGKTGHRRALGDMLVEAGLISRKQISLALEKQKFSSEPLGKVLIEEKLITETELFLFLGKQYALSSKTFDSTLIRGMNVMKLRGIVNKKDAIRYRVVPLDIDAGVLSLAILDPFDVEKLNGFESIINFNLSVALIREPDFRAVFKKLYNEEPSFGSGDGGDLSSLEQNAVKLNVVGDAQEADTTSKYVAVDKDNEAEKLANRIISYGITSKASDIHIEHDIRGSRVRYRIDGVLREMKDPLITKRLQAKITWVVSRLKVMANLDIAERRLPQDGSIRLSIYDDSVKDNVTIDIRVAINRGIFGENVIMRIIDSRKAAVRLDQLSHSKEALASLRNLLKSPSGMILVTGPTGCGKSSTLYAAIQHLNGPNTKIVTAEDPVEYKIAGVMQSQTHPKIGLTFARLLKSFLRSDPDIIMVGEIRDVETCEMATEAALTGHLVLSTLHTQDAIGAIARLRDLGVSNLQIASSLKGVMAQRLVRAICDKCKKPYMPDEEDWQVIFPDPPLHVKFAKGVGCSHCSNTGFSGRIAISELFVVTSKVAKAILANGDEHQIYEAAKASGMKSMLEDGISKLERTTLSEIIRVIQPESVSRIRAEHAAISSRFPELKIPPGATLEYQTITMGGSDGLTKEKIHELFNQYRLLRTKVGEPTTHLTLSMFKEFIESHMNKKNADGKSGEFRINYFSKNDRSIILAEALVE